MTVKDFTIVLLKSLWPLVVLGSIGLTLIVIDIIKLIRRKINAVRTNRFYRDSRRFRLRLR